MIYIVAGAGVGQKKKITGYNNTTKIATVSSAWAANGQPDSTSLYSLGELRTTEGGEFMGVFNLPLYQNWQASAPDNAWYRFTTGMKQFRLMDVPSGRLNEASTTSEAYFFATGQRTTLSPRPQGPISVDPGPDQGPGDISSPAPPTDDPPAEVPDGIQEPEVIDLYQQALSAATLGEATLRAMYDQRGRASEEEIRRSIVQDYVNDITQGEGPSVQSILDGAFPLYQGDEVNNNIRYSLGLPTNP